MYCITHSRHSCSRSAGGRPHAWTASLLLARLVLVTGLAVHDGFAASLDDYLLERPDYDTVLIEKHVY